MAVAMEKFMYVEKVFKLVIMQNYFCYEGMCDSLLKVSIARWGCC